MSVFRVNLSQGSGGRHSNGYLDGNRMNGRSVQRTVSITGPNRAIRFLRDGETFTDVNFYKRYTTASLPANEAFLELVSDDGSVWVDNSQDNSFPKSYTLTVAAGSAFSANVVDILGDNGSAAVFTLIQVTTTGTAPTFRFNGKSDATLTIEDGTTKVFDKGDLLISKLEIDNTQSGNATTTVTVFVSIKAVAKS